MIVQIAPLSKVDFYPTTVAQEIIQNVSTILATAIGTVPLHRAFGVSFEGVDRPLPVAEMMIRQHVIEAVQKYEPRAKILKVDFTPGTAADRLDGKFTPLITVEIADG